MRQERVVSQRPPSPRPPFGPRPPVPCEIVIGQEYIRTPYSSFAEHIYYKTQYQHRFLDTSEYYVVTEGYLRESVCMKQCNLFIQVLKDPELKQTIEIYRRDVCEPNLTELYNILCQFHYPLPGPYNACSDQKKAKELGDVHTKAIDDRNIIIGHYFMVQGFIEIWKTGIMLSHRADVRDAFVRNFHRANRWHLAAREMAIQKGYLPPQPQVIPHQGTVYSYR